MLSLQRNNKSQLNENKSVTCLKKENHETKVMRITQWKI